MGFDLQLVCPRTFSFLPRFLFPPILFWLPFLSFIDKCYMNEVLSLCFWLFEVGVGDKK